MILIDFVTPELHRKPNRLSVSDIRYGCQAGAERGGQPSGGIRRCAGDDETAPALPAVSET